VCPNNKNNPVKYPPAMNYLRQSSLKKSLQITDCGCLVDFFAIWVWKIEIWVGIGHTTLDLDNITILGVTFDKNLKWSAHIANVIKKANCTTYLLRMLNLILLRSPHRQVIFIVIFSAILPMLPQYGQGIWKFLKSEESTLWCLKFSDNIVLTLQETSLTASYVSNQILGLSPH